MESQHAWQSAGRVCRPQQICLRHAIRLDLIADACSHNAIDRLFTERFDRRCGGTFYSQGPEKIEPRLAKFPPPPLPLLERANFQPLSVD
jgi:hypothetical protein